MGRREPSKRKFQNLHDAVKPALPRVMQIALRRWLVGQQRKPCGAVGSRSPAIHHCSPDCYALPRDVAGHLAKRSRALPGNGRQVRAEVPL